MGRSPRPLHLLLLLLLSLLQPASRDAYRILHFMGPDALMGGCAWPGPPRGYTGALPGPPPPR